MALEVRFTEGGNKVTIPNAVEVRDLGNGQISIKLLTNPTSSWVDRSTSTKVPTGASFTIGGGPGRKNYLPDAFEGVFSYIDNINKDPHRYLNGSDYTIAESVTRATNRVYDGAGWWGVLSNDEKGTKKDLATIVKVLIKDGKGRDEVYRIGGKAKTMHRSGSFPRYTLVQLFELAALYEGLIKAPVLKKNV